VDTDALKKHVSGKLYLGIIDNTVTDSASPLPQALQAFVSRGHDVHLDVYVGTPAELEERVLDGRLHIAVGHFPLHVPGLTYTDLYCEPDGLYCGKGHALAGRLPGDAALDEAIASSRVVARGYLQQHDLRMLKVSKAAATVDNIEAQAILILSGAYIGFLPIHYAARWVARGEMHQICPAQLGSHWPFCAITRRAAAPPTILQVFMIDLMESYRMVQRTAPIA
jgi:DNA-binding transcriptional LysR family regulator